MAALASAVAAAAVVEGFCWLYGRARLYAWAVLPPAAVVALVYGLEAGIDVGVRLFALLSASTTAFAGMDYLEAARAASRLGLPPAIAYSPLIVLRIADYMAAVVGEARASLRGKGLRGARLLLALPVPLVVYALESSASLAVALAYRSRAGPIHLHSGRHVRGWVAAAAATLAALPFSIL